MALAFLVLPREQIVLLLPVLLASLVTSRNLLAWDAQPGGAERKKDHLPLEAYRTRSWRSFSVKKWSSQAMQPSTFS